jgi:hypothetical protein
MSVPNKSLDKTKRYAGVKANDFVNKPRTNDVNRSAGKYSHAINNEQSCHVHCRLRHLLRLFSSLSNFVCFLRRTIFLLSSFVVRPQGWANLGKINSRRIPPPANLPSLKSETGIQAPTYDPTVCVNHGWTSNDNIPAINAQNNPPTQQQIDSAPVNLSAPTTPAPSSAETEKSRIVPTWSTITAGINTSEPIPNLLGLTDFPRLANTPDRKSSSMEFNNVPANPSFRPANLATWKEGGGSRVQPLMADVPPMSLPNASAHSMQQSNSRAYPPSPMVNIFIARSKFDKMIMFCCSFSSSGRINPIRQHRMLNLDSV